jgi:pimeloyl-ACP methyl ester carboxylesterase
MELVPLIDPLAKTHLVVAPDLAGYGLSDPFTEAKPPISHWVHDLIAVAERLGVETASIYAQDSSIPIAAALAAQMGERVRGLIIDDPFVMTEDERRGFLDRFPHFAPESTGSYLLRLWDAVHMECIFRPAHVASLATRLDRDMSSPLELDARVRAYLRAGAHAHKGIRAGFEADLEGILNGIACPILALRDTSTPDARMPRVPAYTKTVAVGRDAAARAEAIVTFDAALPAPTTEGLTKVPLTTLTPGGFSRCFVPVDGGHLHALVNLEGAGRPVLVLHDPAGSSALVKSFTQPMIGRRPVIALDLPGNGESDNLLDREVVTSAAYARLALQAVQALGIEEIDVVGRYSGGPVAMEMAFQRPDMVKHLVLAAVAIYDPEDIDDVLIHYTPDMTPRPDGSHLVLGWHNMRNQALFWPWFRETREGIVWGEPQLDPALINQRVLDLLRTGNMYQKAYAAMWTYPMAERLKQLTVPTLVCAPKWDPIADQVEQMRAIAPHCTYAILPDKFTDWAPAFESFFDGAAGPSTMATGKR